MKQKNIYLLFLIFLANFPLIINASDLSSCTINENYLSNGHDINTCKNELTETEKIIQDININSFYDINLKASNSDSPSITDSYYRNDKLPTVKNQYSSNTCWAFAANGSIETKLLKDSNEYFDLSEVHMEYGSTYSSYNKYGLKRAINEGGSINVAMNYFYHNIGGVKENNLTMDNYLTKITTQEDISEDEFNGDEKQIDVNEIAVISNNNGYDCNTEMKNKIKGYILSNGSVNTNIYYVEAAPTYNYLNASLNNQEDVNSNHAVMIVGWDDDYSSDNFTTKPETNGAWIIQNSHGEYANDNGYLYVSYEDKNVCNYVSVFNDIDTEFEDNYYETTNVATRHLTVSASSTTMYVKTVFDKKNNNDELLTEVAINNPSNTLETADVYVINDDTTEFTLDLEPVVSGVIQPTSYNTLKLSEPVKITSDKYQVIIKYYVPLVTQTAQVSVNLNYFDQYPDIEITENKNYYSTNGETWYDMANVKLPVTLNGITKTAQGVNPDFIVGTRNIANDYTNSFKELEYYDENSEKQDEYIEELTKYIYLPVENLEDISYKIKIDDDDTKFTTITKDEKKYDVIEMSSKYKEGQHTLTIEINNKTITKEFTIVKTDKIKKIEFIDPATTLTKGESKTIEIKVYPSYLSFDNINFTSSDENIARINENKINALNSGNTNIKACVENVCAEYELVVDKDIFEKNNYLTDINKNITNVEPETTKESLINYLNDNNITYEINYPSTNTGDYLSSGTTIKLNNDDDLVYTIIIFGDVYADGQITKEDYELIKTYMLEENSLNDYPLQLIAADVNGDKKIDVIDYIKLYNCIRIDKHINQNRAVA